MRGRIVFVNPQTKTGLIFGADRQRYQFDVTEWHDDAALRRNLEVKFQTKGEQALNIKLFSHEDMEEEIPLPDDPIEPPLTTRPASPSGAKLSKAARNETDDPALTTAGYKAPPLSQGILLSPEGRRPAAWKFYLIGLGAALLFVVLALLISHFM